MIKNKKRLLILIILLLITTLSVTFTFFDDFLYKDDILKITDIELVDETSSFNTEGLEEKYYTKSITGIFTTGNDKGKSKELKYVESFSSVTTEKYRVGDKIFINDNNIKGLKRDTYVVSIVFLFVIAIYLVGNIRGLLAVFTVMINSIIFYYGLNYYLNGINLIILCIIESIIFTVFSLLVANGKNKKTFAAIISVFVSLFLLLLGILIITKFTNFSGISFNNMSYVTVPVEDVFVSELIIGGLGAIMDVAITMSSAIGELIEKDKSISVRVLNKSGKEIGKDIMGTMMNVLFFTYLCSGLPLFCLALRNGFSMYNYITSNFTLEITRFLVGSIGIIMTIPIATFISIKIIKRGDKI